MIDLWKKNILDLNKSVDVDDISQTIESAMDVLERQGYAGIDLCFVKNGCVNTEHLASVLRVTAQCHEQVRGWKHALGICYVSAKENNYDPDDVLYGLI